MLSNKCFYEVLVGNIGKVWQGTNQLECEGVFNTYKAQSESNYGRAAGEDVTIWRDGELIWEFEGAIRANLDDETWDAKISP